jgi:hypothetical protein
MQNLIDGLSQTSQIKETRDYNLFYTSNSEVRHLSKEHLEKIKSEIGEDYENYRFSPVIVVLDPDPSSEAVFRIIEGQQRFQTHKDFKFPIPYIIVSDDFEVTVEIFDSVAHEKMVNSKFKMEDVLAESSEYSKIYETTNYELFGFINANRDLVDANLNRIRESLKTKHLKPSCLIVGFDPNPKEGGPLKIIDGQHRYKVLKELALPVTYTIWEDFDMNILEKSLGDVELLNTASEVWDITAFMMSKATLGVKSYVNYQKLKMSHGGRFEHEIIFYVMNGNPGRTRMTYQMFKDGKLELDDTDTLWVFDKLNFLNEFSDKISKQEVGKRYYLKALFELSMVENLNIDRIKEKILYSNWQVPSSKSISFSLDRIRDVYNKGITRNKIYVYDSGKGFKVMVE